MGFAGTTVSITHNVGKQPIDVKYYGYKTTDNKLHTRTWGTVGGSELLILPVNSYLTDFTLGMSTTQVSCDAGGYCLVSVTF